MVMKSNTIVIGAILILGVNMLLVHYSKMKDWDAPTLGGLIRRALNGKKDIIIRLDKENEELRNEIHNLRREAFDKARRSEETKTILKKFKKEP